MTLLEFFGFALSIAVAVGVGAILVGLAKRLARRDPAVPGERLAALEWLKAEAEAKGRGKGGAADAPELWTALEALQREVAELAERMDFAERLLAKEREPDRLAPGRD